MMLSTATKPWPHCDRSQRGTTESSPYSPRLQSRGPIATIIRTANKLVGELLSTATKPWPHCDGTWTRPCWRTRLVSPRLQSRGPIATRTSGSGWSPPRAALHGYKAVAPLRPWTSGRKPGRCCPLSTATKPWPHCDDNYRYRVPGTPLLSTATKPWPHCDQVVGCTWSTPPSLHGYKAVAPLRPGSSPFPFLAVSPLHGYKAVAPLRRETVWSAHATPAASPRLQSRGPIAT